MFCPSLNGRRLVVRSPFSPLIVAFSALNQDAIWHVDVGYPGRQPEKFFVSAFSSGSSVACGANTRRHAAPDHFLLRLSSAWTGCKSVATQQIARLLTGLRSVQRAGIRWLRGRLELIFFRTPGAGKASWFAVRRKSSIKMPESAVLSGGISEAKTWCRIPSFCQPARRRIV